MHVIISLILYAKQTSFHHFTMANQEDEVAACKGRFSILDIENRTFLEVVLSSSSTLVIAENIFEVLKDKIFVPEELKNVYRQGLFGKNEKARARVKNRVYTLRQNNK